MNEFRKLSEYKVKKFIVYLYAVQWKIWKLKKYIFSNAKIIKYLDITLTAYMQNVLC